MKIQAKANQLPDWRKTPIAGLGHLKEIAFYKLSLWTIPQHCCNRPGLFLDYLVLLLAVLRLVVVGCRKPPDQRLAADRVERQAHVLAQSLERGLRLGAQVLVAQEHHGAGQRPVAVRLLEDEPVERCPVAG